MKTLFERISPHYLEQQRELHSRPKGFGGKGKKWAETVKVLIEHFEATSVLDYGAGQGTLAVKLRQMGLPVRIDEYDPAIRGKERPPGFADLVICTDVLEHVEPDRLSAVLDHLHMLARKAVLFVVALDEANKILSDGRNAHLILQSEEWWRDTVFEAGFVFVPNIVLPIPFNVEKQRKRWIGVGVPYAVGVRC